MQHLGQFQPTASYDWTSETGETAIETEQDNAIKLEGGEVIAIHEGGCEHSGQEAREKKKKSPRPF
jgi:hypothetical protein